MILLGLDSSHSEGSLCLQRDSDILELFNWTQEKSHAELIASFIVKAFKNHQLDPKDIDSYAVNVGPGSFTGIRISINTIKALAFVTGKPIYTFTSLETIAESCTLDDKKLTVAINAHSDLCYVGNFLNEGANWKAQGEISVIKASELDGLLKQPETLFVGDAFTVYKDKLSSLIRSPKGYQDIPSALFLNRLALRHRDFSYPLKNWESLEPFYIRLSSPEEKRAQKN